MPAGDVSLFEDFRFDRRGGVLFRRDQRGVFVPLAIGSRALDILSVLVEHPGDVVSRDEIMNAVWPGTAVEDGNLSVQISALRRILDEGRSEGSCIQTVAGRGYRFVAAVTHHKADALSADAVAALPASSALPAASTSQPLAVPRLSIVVLPFTNLSDDRDQQYFADGVTEDLTTDLSNIEELFVISRNSAFTYKGKSVTAKQVGRELGVRYVLEGSVRRSANQVHISAQLIDAETDAHLWAERFDRDATDLIAPQSEITARIANTLNVTMIRADAGRRTENPDALDYILRGRALLGSQSREIDAEQIRLFELALNLDPQSVEAQSRLAITLLARVLNRMTDTKTADIARAEALIAQALAASPGYPLAHLAKGQLLRLQDRCPEAVHEYEMVLESNRNWVGAISNIGRCKILQGLFEEAIALQQQAMRFSPRDPATWLFLYRGGLPHLLQSQTGEAIAWLEKSRSANPAFPAVHAYLASAYALNGDLDRAAAELAEARRLGSETFSSVAGVLTTSTARAPAIRSLVETTYLAGLRKAGMPEE